MAVNFVGDWMSFSPLVNPKMVKRTPHPGPLPIGSADSADAEREKRSQRLGETMAANCLEAYGLYEISQRLFPLPAGEGQGEGERSVIPAPTRRTELLKWHHGAHQLFPTLKRSGMRVKVRTA
jgi:hypothetical protein